MRYTRCILCASRQKRSRCRALVIEAIKIGLRIIKGNGAGGCAWVGGRGYLIMTCNKVGRLGAFNPSLCGNGTRNRVGARWRKGSKLPTTCGGWENKRAVT